MGRTTPYRRGTVARRSYASSSLARMFQPVVQRAARSAVGYAAHRVGSYARQWYAGASKKRKRVSSVIAQTKRRRSVIGHGGRWAGQFKRARRFKKKGPFRGVSCTIENVGEIVALANDQSILFGTHAFAAQVMGQKVFLAMLRALSFKMGSAFRHQDDYVDGVLSTGTGNIADIIVGYSFNGEPEVVEINYSVKATDSWKLVAIGLWTAFGAVISTAVNEIKFRYMTYIPQVRGTASFTGSVTKLDLCNARVSYMLVDTMKMQNRTGANSPTETDADNIEANPIKVTRYVVKGNCLKMNWSNDTAVTPSFLCNSTTGSRSINTKDTSLIVGLQDILDHAPPGSAFTGLKSRTNQVIQPGHIRRSALKLSGTISMDRMFELVLNEEASGNGNQTIFGQSQWMYCEKSLRTGTGTAVVSVGYEHIMGITLTVHPQKLLPFIRANS